MDFINLIHECAPWVAPQTMAAIVKTESQFRPYAIGINGKTKLIRQPKTKAEAISTANWLLGKGYNIDLGLGQVNSDNLPKYNLTVEDAFDPCRNITVAATILKQNYQSASYKQQGQQAALYAALSAYNTGSFKRGFTNGYVRRVVNNAGTDNPQIIVPAINGDTVATPMQEQERSKQTEITKNQNEPVKVQVLQQQQSSDKSMNVYQQSEQEQNVMVY